MRSLQRETARARKRKSEREREGKTCAQGGGQEIFFYIPLVCLRVQAGTDTALPVCIFFSYFFLHSLNLPLVFAYVYRQVRILLFMFFFFRCFLHSFSLPLVCLCVQAGKHTAIPDFFYRFFYILLVWGTAFSLARSLSLFLSLSLSLSLAE